MKQIPLMLAALTLLFSCSIKEDRIHCQAPVTVRVSDFSIAQEPFTKAQAVSAYNGVQHLTLAFYEADGTEAFKQTQAKDALAEGEAFGEFSTTLNLGSYTMVVLAWGNTGDITLSGPTSATYRETKPWDTFVKTQLVNITSPEAVNLTATLDRIVSAVAVRSTDIRPEGVTHMRFTYSGGSKSFNPSTGLASEDNGFSTTMQYNTNPGSTTYTGSYLFLSTDEQTMDVTIETLDGENGKVIFSKTVTGVPFKRNRITVLTGAIYSKTASAGSFQVNTEWLPQHNLNL